MTGIDLSALFPIAAIFVVAGLVKGVTGMGLPTVAVALLSFLMTPVAAAGLLLVPSFVTNVWQLAAGPAFRPLFVRLWPMMAAIVLGTVPGAALIASGDTRLTASALGAALFLYAALALLLPPFAVPRRLECWLSPPVGLATGVVTGATGVLVIPAVPYLQSLGLSRDDLVQALGLSFTVSTMALALGLFWQNALPSANLGISLLAVPPALLGMWIGQSLRHRIGPALFRRCFLAGLLILGAEMGLRPWL
ncbi:MAG: sulfite exporter TauE/SafE family protein [Methylobacterium mesophilicum]|nr:sulfite exporter TauE/SafE family protein [Methylobacterium mesophilicum]